MGSGQPALKYGALVVFLVGTVGEQVLTKKATYAAYFPAALTELTALAGVVVYPVIVATALVTGRVTRAEVVLPWWKPAVIAVGFALHNVLLNVGSGGSAVPGILVLVLVKLVVPASMVLNMPKCTLGLQYKAVHWAGLVILLSGIVLTVSGPLHDALSAHGQVTRAGKMLIVAVSTVPLAASFTFIEKNLKEHHKSIFTVALWMWVCMFQLLFSTLLVPLSAMLSRLPLSHTWSDLRQGMACYAALHTPDSPKPTDCVEAGRLWWSALVFGLANNLAMPVSTRYGGADLMWFVRSMAVPLSGLLFSSVAVMGAHATALTWPQILGLLVVTLGVLLFNAAEPRKRGGIAALGSAGAQALNPGISFSNRQVGDAEARLTHSGQ